MNFNENNGELTYGGENVSHKYMVLLMWKRHATISVNALDEKNNVITSKEFKTCIDWRFVLCCEHIQY